MQRIFLLLVLIFLAPLATAADAIPKVWDEAALADWVTPVAGLNLRPSHIPAKEYYSAAVDNLRTYPVYFPGREPKGYWEMLQHIGPKPLIQPENLRTQADWIAAGQRVFDEADTPQLRTFDPKLIAQVRDKDFDGTMDLMRWVPTKHGVALSVVSCSGCHVLHTSDGARIPGAPRLAEVSRTRQSKFRIPQAMEPFMMGGATLGAKLYQTSGVPWRQEDTH